MTPEPVPIKPSTEPQQLRADIQSLESENTKLKAHLAELEGKAAASRAKLKAAAQAMESAQQQAVIDGNASGYTEAREVFDNEAQNEAVLQGEIRSMRSGIESRSARVADLRSRQNALETSAREAWVTKNGARITQQLEKSLARYMTLKRVEVGQDPTIDGLIRGLLARTDSLLPLYRKTRDEALKEIRL